MLFALQRLDKRADKSRRGFTLTELAIVVAIISTIVGAIWAIAADVIANRNVSSANKQLTAIAGNVRAAYAEQGGISHNGNTAGNLTQELDRMRIFPTEMRGGGLGIIFHDWNKTVDPTFGLGNVIVTATKCDGSGPASATSIEPCFGIIFYQLTNQACAQFLTGLITSGTRLQEVIVTGAAANTVTPPVDIGVASADCNAAAGNTDILEFVYLLKDNAL